MALCLIRNQGVLAVAEDWAVASPGVFVEFFYVLYQFCSQGIKVDVTNEFQQIRIFFTDNGFVSVLEKVAQALVSFVESHSIAGHQTAHEFAERGRASA